MVKTKGRCIYKDKGGNRLYSDSETYSAKNVKGELIGRSGLYAMMKERRISTKGLKEIYVGKKMKKK